MRFSKSILAAVGALALLTSDALAQIGGNGPSLQTQCGSAEIADATIFASLQVQPPIELGYCFREYQVRADAHFISSGKFGAGMNDTLQDFLALDPSVIRQRIESHITNELGWTLAEASVYGGVVFADIEHAAHPTQVAQFPEEKRPLVGARWALCIRILAEYFPCAEIGWAPVYNPPINGTVPPAAEKVALMGEILGTNDFTGLDFICTNVYPRLWLGDRGLTTIPALRQRYIDIATNAAAGITQMIALADQYNPGFSAQVKPMQLSAYRIYNDQSEYNGVFLLQQGMDTDLSVTLIPQIDVFRNFGVDHVVFWSSRPEFASSLQGTPVHVDDYWRLISCEMDYDGDGLRDMDDYSEWLSYFNTNSPCGDLNSDGVIDVADFDRAIELLEIGPCP